MDPNATLITLLDAIEDNEHQEAIVILNDLFTWIKRGGMKPNTQAAVETLRERMHDLGEHTS
jgi:hypothetical protein